LLSRDSHPRRARGAGAPGILLAACLAAGAPLQAAGNCQGISPVTSAPLTTLQIASGLSNPTFLTAPPGDLNRLFVTEQAGRIRVILNGSLLPTPFLDISALTASPGNGGQGEQGLLSLAFDPGYAMNGRFYVFYTPVSGGENLVARYTRSLESADLADPASGVIAFAVPHPGPFHNGGMLAFGPADGFLYVSSGDGGDYCDRVDHAQDGSLDMGKILRLDVSGLPATVPGSNPFVGPDGVNDEIWAMGLRNPWRFAFDRLTADLYIGDVGQSQREEIDHQDVSSPGGENYGWNLYEGLECPNPSCGSATCSVPSYAPPLLDYDHTEGCAVTGGYVYRGCRMPDLSGTYFYGDFCSAFVRTFRLSAGAVTDPRDLTAELDPGGGLSIDWITSFGEDARGEIYIVDGGESATNSGEIYKIVPVFGHLEVSGSGATPFAVTPSKWSWEPLGGTTSYPISAYRVYRAASPAGPFACLHEGPGFTWTGDAETPPLRSAYYYLVTALNAAGSETSPGWTSGGALRDLSTAPCPP